MDIQICAARLPRQSKRMTGIAMLSLLLWMALLSSLSGQQPPPGNEIIERIGNSMPLDASYFSDTGDSVTLGMLLTKPAVLSLVYYNCPGICTPLLSGEVDVLARSNRLRPGEDFVAITLSFNELENSQLAAEKKAAYLKMLPKGFPADSWHWLTGDNRNIKKLTRPAGFHFIPSGQEFLHPAALIVVDRSGKIIRYLHGTFFRELDLQIALTEAGAKGPFLWRLSAWMHRYDEGRRQYVLDAFHTSAVLISLSLAISLVLMIFRVRRRTVNNQ